MPLRRLRPALTPPEGGRSQTSGVVACSEPTPLIVGRVSGCLRLFLPAGGLESAEALGAPGAPGGLLARAWLPPGRVEELVPCGPDSLALPGQAGFSVLSPRGAAARIPFGRVLEFSGLGPQPGCMGSPPPDGAGASGRPGLTVGDKASESVTRFLVLG